MEVAVALGVLAVALASLAPVLVSTTVMLRDATAESRALVAAISRMEELNALAYEQDVDTLEIVTDATSDLSTSPASREGTGLAPGDPSTMWRDTPGFFDVVDSGGSAVRDAARAATRRRWAISANPAGGADAPLLLQVHAAAIARDAAGPARDSPERRPGDVRLFGLRVRELR
jgi:hypothetical protein